MTFETKVSVKNVILNYNVVFIVNVDICDGSLSISLISSMSRALTRINTMLVTTTDIPSIHVIEETKGIYPLVFEFLPSESDATDK